MNTAFVIFMDAIKNNITNQIVASIQSFFPLSRLITGFVAVIICSLIYMFIAKGINDPSFSSDCSGGVVFSFRIIP